MGFLYLFAHSTMKTFFVVLLLSVILAVVSAQRTNGFDPPSALSNPSPQFSPVSPQSPVDAPGITYAIYSLSPVSADSPAPFSVITLPTAFSYGSGPFSSFTKIPTGHLHNRVSPIPSLSPFSIPSFSPLAPLFGSHSGAGMLQTSTGILVACIIAVLAM